MRAAAEWLSGGGELGNLIRSKDWSATSLGPRESWPQSLRSVTGMMLASRAQIVLFWGTEFVVLYNDGYKPVFSLKHPWALGRPGREAWSEIWDDVLHPLLRGVVTSGEAFWAKDHPFVLARNGFPEETYFDVSYDPVRDESGGVAGVFCIVSETTGRVVGERRLRMLRDLDNAATDAGSVDEVFTRGARVMADSGKDIAFAIGYEWDEESGTARRLCALNVPATAQWAPDTLDANGPWPARELPAGGRVLGEEDLAGLGRLPGGAWPEAVRRVVLLPLQPAGQPSAAFLVVGLSPRLPFDEGYRDYLRLVGASFASAIARAGAQQAERRRLEMLAELDHAKTAFFGNVSHEFRTPLTLLLAPLEEALESGQELPESTRAGLERAHRNALRLLKLVNALLDFSRLEAGRVRAAFEPVDLAQATAVLAANFASACEKAGLAFDVCCEPLPEPVWIDRDMWEKIVLNLLSNAFKFTFKGAIGVSLRHAAGGPQLRVWDTGVGISAGELPLIFDRFHRVEGTPARTHEGSGIGLALVNDLVRLHGGRIDVESEPCKGTALTVSLQYGSAHLPQDQLHAAHSIKSPETGKRARAFVEEALGWLRGAHPMELAQPAGLPLPAGHEARVLVADDNADMRDHIARLLGDHWAVELAADGVEALERLRASRFDLVIADVMMPRLDGFGLLREIRADPALADLAVVMLSARAGEEARIDGLGAGADDYLVKPFSGRELVAQVRSQLSIRHMRRSSSTERERLLAGEKAARTEAQLQRERLTALFTQTPNPIVILRGPNHEIELANAAACKAWAREPSEVLGRPILDALPEIRGQGFVERLDQVLRTGEPYFGREHAAHIAGPLGKHTVYFNYVYAPMRREDGSVEGVLVSAFDVTQEVETRRQVEELRGRAEEANRTKDAFLAMLGHELRNPLSPIVSALKLLRLRGHSSPELDILDRQANHLTRLVDDLLDVSRITRGSLELRRRAVDIDEVVRRAMDMAAPLIEQRRHSVEIRVPSGSHVVFGDSDRLAQVVANLLTNAAKYSDPGTRIGLSVERRGDGIRLSVEDEGVGIAPEMQARIFDLFVQQPQTLDRAHGGLGLGLAIVKNIVEAHEGRVGVESDGPGRGSRFTVELPLAQALGWKDGDPTPAASFRSHDHGPMRILVVDDNADALAMLGESLRHIGHQVELASDGEGALDLARRFRPDVALIDIGLPRMDGYELARRMRALPMPPARLFAVTGYGLETDRQRALDAGFDRHFIKPVEVGEIDEALALNQAA